MRRLIVAIATLVALVGTSLTVARAQAPYTPPPGVEMGITLYPITKFRGNSMELKRDNPRIRGAFEVESLIILRGIWELCSENDYGGRCVRVSATQIGIPTALTVRSARVVGDTGPTFMEVPSSRAGPDLPIVKGEVALSRPGPAPIVAPVLADGGVPGTNPSLKGDAVEFFAAPARNGFRILACSQGNATPRCIQATADTFCKEAGYRDSGWREAQTVNGKPYLSNVLCKTAEDDKGGRSGFRLPF